MATVHHKVVYSLPPDPAEAFGKQIKPYLLRLHQMSGEQLLEMVERIADRRRAFAMQIAEMSGGVSEEQDARNSRPFPY